MYLPFFFIERIWTKGTKGGCGRGGREEEEGGMEKGPPQKGETVSKFANFYTSENLG